MCGAISTPLANMVALVRLYQFRTIALAVLCLDPLAEIHLPVTGDLGFVKTYPVHPLERSSMPSLTAPIFRG